MRWAGYVACMREMINAYEIMSESPMERGHLHDVGVDGRIILEYVLQIYDMSV
jgi:hypothetical protein